MMRHLSGLLLAMLLGSGCAGLHNMMASRSVPEQKLDLAQNLLKELKYSEAIASYQKIVEEYPKSDWAGSALYGIATAYVSVENPRRDYVQALTHFDDLLYQYPHHERAADAKNWRQAIKTILETKKENERLSKSIEKLKQLDLKQEEKRMGR